MAISLKEAVEAMDYDELMKIKMDLESGGFNVKRMVIQKAREKERRHEAKCAVCSNEINAYSSNNYTLIFGPEDFRRKASFCGIDCTEYFMADLRDLKGMKKKEAPASKAENFDHKV
ncbi:MAG: hypothetical protein QS98_C0002G0018 [archaeon GW2011_AR3]|nr:MAG: hypothetical protein QS98_C0002G0018 [archaeon GW2011_AR3]MBS3109992.1 hypothetical protein [Candidatus Woesearchaeota archaeon]